MQEKIKIEWKEELERLFMSEVDIDSTGIAVQLENERYHFVYASFYCIAMIQTKGKKSPEQKKKIKNIFVRFLNTKGVHGFIVDGEALDKLGVKKKYEQKKWDLMEPITSESAHIQSLLRPLFSCHLFALEDIKLGKTKRSIYLVDLEYDRKAVRFSVTAKMGYHDTKMLYEYIQTVKEAENFAKKIRTEFDQYDDLEKKILTLAREVDEDANFLIESGDLNVFGQEVHVIFEKQYIIDQGERYEHTPFGSFGESRHTTSFKELEETILKEVKLFLRRNRLAYVTGTLKETLPY